MTGNELKREREAMGLRQRDVAEEIGCTTDHVRHMECGWVNITKRFLKQWDTLKMKKKMEKMLQGH